MARHEQPGGRAAAPPASDSAAENARLAAELAEAREQQAATSEILRAIARAPTDLRSVLDAITATAARLCRADKAHIRHLEDGQYRVKASFGHSAEEVAYFERHPVEPGRGTISGRAALDLKTVHVPDVLADPEWTRPDLAQDVGLHTGLGVPLLREGRLAGVLILARTTVAPFSAREIEMAETFAAQAVIAIENTRLFGETTAALERETAMSSVLRIISGSPTDLRPVLDAIAENAARLCATDEAVIWRRDGDMLRLVAAWGATPNFDNTLPVSRRSVVGRALHDRAPVHVPDLAQVFASEFPESRRLMDAGYRSLLAAPLLRQGEAIGVIIVRRGQVRPYTEPQIALLRTFADQAVIAIANTRLFEEVQSRNRDLTEALEQQTATGEILGVIASSPTDLKPVLDVVVTNAARLCAAYDCALVVADGDTLRELAHHGPIPFLGDDRFPLTRASVMGRAVLDGRLVHIPDLAESAEFPEGSALARQHGNRTTLAAPLLREGKAFGALVVRRKEVRPFSDKQIALLQSFADQAVIAIENTRLFEEVQSRNRDLTESLEQQTATAEVLGVIARSPTDLKPVLDVVVENAARLCGAYDSLLTLVDGESLREVAHYGPIPSPGDERRALTRGTVSGRAVLESRAVHIHDILDAEDFPEGRARGERFGFRTTLAVPLLRDGKAFGVLLIRRAEVRPFTDRQIELLQTFADQAVIAINNTRQFNETKEALERQTATGDILKIIASSPTDSQPVFDAIVQSAARLFERDAALRLVEGGNLRRRARSWVDAAEFHGAEVLPIDQGNLVGRVMLSGEPDQVVDTHADDVPPYARAHAHQLTYRSVASAPLMRDGAAIGVISVTSNAPGRMTDKQMSLLATFADQAVIAINNVRLFEEVQARSRELGEALEQQIATSDILGVISSSLTDAQPVFEAIVRAGLKLFPEAAVSIAVPDGELIKAVAVAEPNPDRAEAWRGLFPFPLTRDYMHGVAILDRRLVDVADVREAPADLAVGARRFMGSDYRAVTMVPMMRGDAAIGALSVVRMAPGPFSDKQRAILQTFADQAVIAINNVRLFNEVQARTEDLAESLRQQTATADVLKVISRSTFDLQTVLRSLLETAVQLCEADQGTITRERDGKFYRAEAHGFAPEFMAAVRDIPIQPDRGSASGRALLEGRIVHIPDIREDPEFTFAEAKALGGFRTIVAVPMMKEGAAIGVLVFTRHEPRPFTDKQIELVSTFADQAAIAIENVRLFDSVEARTRELARSLEELRAAQDRLVQTEKLASLGQLTAGIAHEIKNPLNFVNNFAALSVELIGEMGELLQSPDLDADKRAEIAELAGMVRGNLEKVTHHGQRADSIVKNMLLHSRSGSGDHRPVDINAIVEESLNLAYHGARAERRDFNITLERSLDPAAGQVDLYPQEITRVLLNLISNGFYAATKRKAQGGEAGFEPVLRATTRDLGDKVEITIRDNGTGIPPDVREKIFNPFFTTKPPGEGTGLGLSLSHDIVVKQHAGSIAVDTEPGRFTEFRIVLPRGGASIAKTEGRA